jgi:transcriptional regulator with XRE-family HTH domain
MTPLQSMLSALVRRAHVPQARIAEQAGVSEKHLSQMVAGRVEGTLTMWQAVLDAAGAPLPNEASAYEEGWAEAERDEGERQKVVAKEAAALAGVAVSTWTAYVTRGYAPKPDGQFGRQRYWLRLTVEQWKANRAGQGARTDLETP